MEKFNVMLAHPKAEKITENENVIIQPKLDGVRCYTRWLDGRVRMFSRNHKEFHNCKHICTQLEPILKHYPELILDGELYNHRFKKNFNKIISLVRKSKPSQQDKFESASYLQYHIYDIFNTSSPKSVYLERYHWITHLFNYKYRKLNTRAIKVVDTAVVWGGEEEIVKRNRKHLADGYEGSILRKNTEYEQKRSKSLQKVKQWKDTEATITGFVEGKGKRRGTVGKFLARDTNGIDFGMPVCFDYDQMRKMWDNVEDYVGKTATFIYFEKTPRGSYRFPRYKELRNYE